MLFYYALTRRTSTSRKSCSSQERVSAPCECVVKGLPDWKVLKDHLHKEGRVSKEHCHRILNDALEMLSTCPRSPCREGAEHAEAERPSHGRRRHPRPVLRHGQDAGRGRDARKHKVSALGPRAQVPVPGGLRGPRLLLRGGRAADLHDQNDLRGDGVSVTRKPRMPPDDLLLQLQDGVPLQVRPGNLRTLHGDLRRPPHLLPRQRQIPRTPRWNLPRLENCTSKPATLLLRSCRT